MSCNVWTRRKEVYRKGYVLIPLELMHEYYDWEADPMCDCTPARKFRDHTGKWRIEAYRTYAYREGDRAYVGHCREAWADTETISEDIYNALWKELTENNIPLIELKELFLDKHLESESIRLMP